MNINKKKELSSSMREYFREFLWENSPLHSFNEDENFWEQVRAMFTTICIIQDIEADTFDCDEYLEYVYLITQCKESKETFENYMLSHIV